MFKKIVFLVLHRKKMVFHRKTNFPLAKRWFWPQENHLFARGKLVFYEKPSFRGKTQKTKKTSYLETGEGMLKKMVFLVLPRNKMVTRWFFIENQLSPRKKMVLAWSASGKPSFCEVKVGFSMKNHLLPGKTKKQKNIFFGEWGGDVEKDGFFGFAS